ncbi:MAG: hypothetical protein J6I84_03615 [Bacilli bacterium]|nr:hypothetical protein [Bacilli bacterium]
MTLNFETYRKLEPNSHQLTTYVCYHANPYVFSDEPWHERTYNAIKKFVPENIGRVNIGYIQFYRFFKAYYEGRNPERSKYVDSLGKLAGDEVVKIEFSEGLRVYALIGGGVRGIYSNAKKIKFGSITKGIELQKEPRVYIMNLKLYERYILLPKLHWPKRMKNFLGWMRKKSGPLGFSSESTYELWERTEDPEKYLESFVCESEKYYPPRNIKSIEELESYNKWLLLDFPEILKKKTKGIKLPIELIAPLDVIPIKVSQSDIDRWILTKKATKLIETI